MIQEERIEAVRDKATNNFWEIVAEEFPEITEGELPAEEEHKFLLVCIEMVRLYVRMNEPDDVYNPESGLYEAPPET